MHEVHIDEYFYSIPMVPTPTYLDDVVRHHISLHAATRQSLQQCIHRLLTADAPTRAFSAVTVGVSAVGSAIAAVHAAAVHAAAVHAATVHAAVAAGVVVLPIALAGALRCFSAVKLTQQLCSRSKGEE